MLQQKIISLRCLLISIVFFITLTLTGFVGCGDNNNTIIDTITFISQTEVDRSTPIVSNAITVRGINIAVPISISGSDGTYSVNGGYYTNTPGTVNNGDSVTIRLTSSEAFSTSVSTVLNIGGISASFIVTTESLDTMPEPFFFEAKTDTARNIYVYSNTIVVCGINAPASISVSGSDGAYSINGGNYTQSNGIVNEVDFLTLRLTSSPVSNTTVSTVLHTDNVSCAFNVTTEQSWASVSAGDEFAVALKIDGTLYSWGDNWEGQLGRGYTSSSNIPYPINSDTDWASVSAGGNFSVAIKNDGSMYAWGSNQFGSIGDGTWNNKNIPTRIGLDNNWRFVSAGSSSAVALKTDGSMYAWGFNYYGQLGFGLNSRSDINVPTRIGNATDWAMVSYGGLHAAAIKTDGSLYTWGVNWDGQLGDGTWAHKSTPPTRVGSDTDWLFVSAGGNHSVAIKKNGSMFSWGSNSSGQLGDGTWENKNVPTRVGIGNETNWSVVSAGSHHTVAIKKDGSIYAWGWNASEQLGDGLNVNQNIPKQIGNNTDYIYASARWSRTRVIKKDGSLLTWGTYYDR